MIAGVLTASELALLRTRPQRTQLYLAIPEYKTVYTAREDGAPTSDDNTYSINYDGGVGVIGNIKIGMTLLVGSSAGAWDIGIARIRDTPLDFGGNGTFFIGITSEIDWADNLYFTIIDDYGLWPRHPFVSAGIVSMDYAETYTNQNVYGDPVPIMSSHAVVELTGASVTVHFDASDSYNCIGTPDHYDYAWYVDNVLTGATAAIDIAFASVGTYTIRLEVTADYDIGSPVITKTSVAVRYVIVHDRANPLNASFTLERCEGDFSGGGWSYRVTMNAKATEAYVRDRTLCLLVARDWYGDTEQSIGPLVGRENIVCVGWVDGESLRRSNDRSTVSFDVQGPEFWLGVQEGFPTGIDDTTAAPTDWSHIQALDPRKGLFSFLHWRTTATVVTDCYITSDDHRLATTYTPAGTLLEQLRAIAERVNAKTVCDRYGRLFCEIDTQFITPVSRTFPVVQTLTDRDWRDEITIERNTVNTAGQVDLSGVYWSGTIATSAAIFSLSPGHIPSHYGEKRQIQRIALDDQAEANTLAGLWFGYLNNEYPNVDTPFSSNYRAVDIAPRMFVQMNLAAGDTPRGITWTNKKLIPRRVSFGYDAREAMLLTDVTFEAEAFPSDAIVGDPPIEPPAPPVTITPPPPTLCNDPAALNFGGLAPCIYPEYANVVVVITTHKIGRALDFFTASPATDVHWTDIKTGLPVGCGMHNIKVGGVEGWLIINTNGTLDNDVYYCSDVTAVAPTWSLVMTRAQSQTYDFVWGGFNPISMAVLPDGTCYLAAKTTGAPAGRYYYWTLAAGAVVSYDYLQAAKSGTCTGHGPESASCDDGIDVYIATENPALPDANMWISPTRSAYDSNTAGYRTAYSMSNDRYVVTGGLQFNLPSSFIRNNVWVYGRTAYVGGVDYWVRDLITDAHKPLICSSNISFPNDSDGGTGVFSANGATGSAFFDFGQTSGVDILWTADSVAALNTKRSIAYSADTGATWQTRDGNWAAIFGAWEGGATMVWTGNY